MSENRVPHIASGRLMVVTDLHGDWQTYTRLRDLFFWHLSQGGVDRLILCGDVLHAPPDIHPDRSYDILQDILLLRQHYGDDLVTLLCGNHEMPHIYDVMFTRDEKPLPLNAPLEQRISAHDRDGSAIFARVQIHEFLLQLPLYITTHAGVMLSHAGAPPFAGAHDWYATIREFDHRSLLKLADDQLRSFNLARLRQDREYRQQARELLAVEDVNDPRFTNLFRAQLLMEREPLMRLLWDTLFLRNEYGYPLVQYARDVVMMLEQASVYSPVRQHVLCAGHIMAENGYQIVTDHKLRFASGAHAKPRHRAKYLLFDAAARVRDVRHLTESLQPVWDS